MTFDWIDFHRKTRKELSSDPAAFQTHFVQIKGAHLKEDPAVRSDRRVVFAFDLSPTGQHDSSLVVGAPHLRVLAGAGAVSALRLFDKDLEARVVGQEVLLGTNKEAKLYHGAKTYADVKKMINTGKLKILDDYGAHTRSSDLLNRFGRIVTTYFPDSFGMNKIRKYLAQEQCYLISDTAGGIITYSNK